MSVLVLILLVLVTISAFIVVRITTSGEQTSLLKERTSEVVLVLNASITTLASSLTSLGEAVRLAGNSPTAFRDAAGPVLASNPGSRLGLAVVRPGPFGYVVETAAGKGLSPGQVLDPEETQSAERAVVTRQLVATPVIGSGAARIIGFAVAAPGGPHGTVVYEQLALGPVAPTRQSSGTPFRELSVALYAAPRPDRQQVVLATTSKLPPPGAKQFRSVSVGASRWLLVTAAQRPLVGSLTAWAPWLVLATGLVVAVLVALLVEQMARRRDLALSLYAGEHVVAQALQRSLLPELAAFPGVEVASRYVAGGAGQQVGGDWFDVFPLDGGQIGAVIGDVIGHDIVAAAAMSQIRAALRAYAGEGSDPAGVLERLEGFVDQFGQAEMVTVFYGVLEPPAVDGSRVLRYANAGHLPPLLSGPDGRVGEVESRASLIIGAPAPVSRVSDTCRLQAGSTLLMFTDGLVEVPGRSIRDSLDELADWLRAMPPGPAPAALCDQLVKGLPSGKLRDDIAILALRIPVAATAGRL